MWIHPLQFGLLIQVGCPVDQVKGSKEQREGYSGNPVYLAHTVKGLLGLWRFGLWLLLGLSWGRWGAFGNRGQSRVPGNIWSEGCSSGSWVGCGVVLLQEGLLLLLLLILFEGEAERIKFRVLYRCILFLLHNQRLCCCCQAVNTHWQLNGLSVSFRMDFKILLLVFKVLNGSCLYLGLANSPLAWSSGTVPPQLWKSKLSFLLKISS